MAGPWDDYATPDNVAALVTSEAQRQGVDPQLALRVAHQESRLNPAAVSPKGAVGVMQLMPDTARGMGVDPTDLGDNIRGGVSYLKQQVDTFGDPKLAAAAYNAGPEAVRRHGGVPPYAETQHYVQAVAPGDAQPETPPWLDYAPAAAPKAAPARPKAPPQLPAAPPAAARPGGPTIAQDAASGFAQPFVNLGHDVMQNYRAKIAQAQGPAPSLLGAGKQALSDFGSSARLVGDVLGLTSAPVQAVVRPVARAVNANGPTPYQPGGYSLQNGKPAFVAPRALHGEEAQGAVENMINTALMGARPANGAVIPPKMPAKNLAQLDQEQAKLWNAVDASGYRFPKTDVTQAAADIRQIVNDAGPDLYENSAKIANRVESLAEKGDLTPAQANRLRTQVGEKLLTPGSTEGSVGGEIKARIDQLIDGANDPTIDAARQAYKQFMKYKEVNSRLEDAGINQAASGNGGNANAARQALKPLIKNKSGARMRNLTPDESAALKGVVNGTPLQNLLRAGSAFDPFHSKLGTMLQTGLGVKTGGLSATTIPLGMAATAGEKAIAAKNIQALLDLISTGGVASPAAPVSSMLSLRGLALRGGQATPMLSPAGLTGAGVVAAPLTRLPSAEVRAKMRSKAGQRAQ